MERVLKHHVALDQFLSFFFLSNHCNPVKIQLAFQSGNSIHFRNAYKILIVQSYHQDLTTDLNLHISPDTERFINNAPCDEIQHYNEHVPNELSHWSGTVVL